MRMRSLRAKLAFTYAGIALLTAVILGGILLTVLGNYYSRVENEYLVASAARITRDLPTVTTQAQLDQWTQFAALITHTRVRVFAANGSLLADSGSPADLNPQALVGPNDGQPGLRHFGRGRLPRPLGQGPFGGNPDGPRSGKTLQVGVPAVLGQPGGSIALSEAPASGRDVLLGVAETWLVAAALAVALAALAGYMLSSRITHPVEALTEASDRMAEGDLSARAPVGRDDEVGRLADSFNAMADRMQTTVTSLRRFVADAAHELGTPLTALQADLELAEGEATTADGRRFVTRALGQARRLEDLSQNLLRLSRIEAWDSSAVSEPVDLAALSREAFDAIASRAEQAGLTVDALVAEGPVIVLADATKLQGVLDSLLDNAIKFTPEGGRVALGLQAEGAQAHLWVADTGVGIPVDEQSEVFERFHRGRNVSAYPGSGLGLAIVRATAERFGGTVDFESSEAGTRFDVRLPLA